MLNNYVYYINGKWIESNKALIPFNDMVFYMVMAYLKH